MRSGALLSCVVLFACHATTSGGNPGASGAGDPPHEDSIVETLATTQVLAIETIDSGFASGYGGGEYDPASAQLAEIYSTVRSLLAMRRGARPDYNPQAASVPSFAPIDLLSALTILQNQAMLPQAQPATSADAAYVVQRMKHELVEQASKFQADHKGQVAAAGTTVNPGVRG